MASDDVIRPIVAACIMNPSNGKEEMVYALIDSGADRDFISTELA